MEQNHEVIERFGRVVRLARRLSMQGQGSPGRARMGQGRVLKLLHMQPGISQKELGYLLDIRPQSLSELLAKLEKVGYIKRTPSAEDGRMMDIELTDAGQKAAQQLDEGNAPLLGCLTEEEQQTLSGYLARIIEMLEAQLGSEEGEPDWREREYRGRGRFDGRPGFGSHSGFGDEPRCNGCERRCPASDPGCARFSPDGGEGRGRGGFGRGFGPDERGCGGFGRGYGPEGHGRGGFGPDGMRRDGRFEALGGRHWEGRRDEEDI